MKKKFSALQKDIEDQREEIRTMFAHKKELYQVINTNFQSLLIQPQSESGLCSLMACLKLVQAGKQENGRQHCLVFCLASLLSCI